jgi:hypothetical protein
MKIKITRHHSNGPIEIHNDPMYAGVVFNMSGGLNIFLEFDDKENSENIAGLAIVGSADGWNVTSAHPGSLRLATFKESVYKPS